MTYTDKCKEFNHEFLYNNNTLVRKRICWKCGLKQTQQWLANKTEEM